MRNFIRRHRLQSFFICTMLLAFLLILPHAAFPELGQYALSLPQLSPFLAAAVLAIVLRDRTILSHMKERLSFNAVVARWVIPAAAIPAVCIGVSSLILTLGKSAYVPWSGNAVFYWLNLAGILIGCIGEELGWRGFLLPNLQRRFSPLASSLIVGALWGIWHLNLTDGLTGFLLYNITIIEMSILMTWLFNKTGNNLVLMIVWHFSFNLASRMFLWDRFNNRLFVVEGIVFGMACLLLLVKNPSIPICQKSRSSASSWT